MNTRETPWKGTVMGALLLALLGLLFFLPLYSGDRILFPVHTDTYLPWRDETPENQLAGMKASANYLMADKVHIFHPGLILNRRSFSQGKLPLWDPHTLGGVPLLAQGLSAPFHLANLCYLLMAPEHSYAFTAFIHTVLAAVFMLLFLRALEIRHFAAFMGGFIFGFSGWMLIHVHYFQITGAAMWLPLMLLGAERLVRGGRLWWLLALALGVWQSFCAGFPQVAVMSLYTAAVYALIRAGALLKTDRKAALQRLTLAGAGILLGLVLSGIQFVPSAATAYSGDSTREPATKEQIKERRLEPLCLLAYLAPDLFGCPELSRQTESPYYKSTSLLSLATLPQPTERPDLNYVEYNGYVGILPLILALLVFLAGPRKGWIFFAVLLGFSLCTALGMPGFTDLAALLPGLLIGDAKRFLFLAAACLSVLAAFTLDAFWKPGGGESRVLVGGLILAAVLILVCGGAWIALTASSEEGLREAAVSCIHERTGVPERAIDERISQADLEVQRDHLSSVLLRTLMHLAFAGLVLLLSTGWTRDRPVSRPLIVMVLMLDLFTLGGAFNRPAPDRPLYDPSNPVVSFLAAGCGHDRIIRFNHDLVYPVNMGSIHRVPDAQGYVAFYSKRYRGLLELLEPGRTADYGAYCLRDQASLFSPVLDLLSVKYVLATEDIDAEKAGAEGIGLTGLEEAYRRKSVRVYENRDRLPRAFLHRKAVWVDGPDEASRIIGSEDFDARAQVILEGSGGGDPAGDEDPAGGEEGEGGAEGEEVLLPVRITSFLDDEVDVEVKGGPGWLVLNDTFCNGWTAEMDGRPAEILPANLAFRAVEIPDGALHRVRFAYRPASVRVGGALTLAGLVLCAVLAVLFWRKRG